MNRVTSLWAALLLSTVLTAHASTEANAEPHALAAETQRSELREKWGHQAREAMWEGDFETLERLYREASQDKSDPFIASDRLSSFFHGATGGMKPPNASDLHFGQLTALTLEWTKLSPRSPLPHLLHAHALAAHAWAIRGGTYSDQLTDHALKEFKRLSRQAADHLVAHKEVVFQDPQGYALLMRLGYQALGMNQEQLWRLALQGVKLAPHDDAVYLEMLVAVLPKWGGGSAEDVENFIRLAVKTSRPQWGMGMYARLYIHAAAGQYGHGLMSNTRIKWADMKQGLDDLNKHFPSLRTHNRYAYFACMAEDRETYRRQMALLDGTDLKTYRDAWGNNPDRVYESCKTWAGAL